FAKCIRDGLMERHRPPRGPHRRRCRLVHLCAHSSYDAVIIYVGDRILYTAAVGEPEFGCPKEPRCSFHLPLSRSYFSYRRETCGDTQPISAVPTKDEVLSEERFRSLIIVLLECDIPEARTRPSRRWIVPLLFIQT